jgi:flavin reductase (DIM6/NTAB) family NADH-FMN oxidoreductase RutF
MPVEKAEFRQALGHFAASVTVVTLVRDDEVPAGITVTAFSSLSLEPPLVLVCIDKRARLHDQFQLQRSFAVNILAADQEAVSRRFAHSDPDQFKEIGYSLGPMGAPLIQGAICSIECRVVDLLPGGDHTIIVGEVESSRINEGKPLLYFRGGYCELK